MESTKYVAPHLRTATVKKGSGLQNIEEFPTLGAIKKPQNNVWGSQKSFAKIVETKPEEVAEEQKKELTLEEQGWAVLPLDDIDYLAKCWVNITSPSKGSQKTQWFNDQGYVVPELSEAYDRVYTYFRNEPIPDDSASEDSYLENMQTGNGLTVPVSSDSENDSE